MILLETLKCFFMLFDGSLELLDVFCTPFPKSCLRLAIALLAFFRCRVYLKWALGKTCVGTRPADRPYRLAASLSLLHLGGFLSQALLFGIWGGFGEGFFLKVFDLGDGGGCLVDS